MTAAASWPTTPAPGSPQARSARVRAAMGELCDVTTADLLLANPPPPTRYVVPGVLPHGLALLYGKPKQGKSWLALDLALAVASGGQVAGHFSVEQGDVLYLALEDGPSRLYERSQALLSGDDAPLGLTFVTRLRASLLATIQAWHGAVDEPRLIILDTLQKARGASKSNGNAYAEDYAALTVLKDLADDLGVCLLLVHHARKGSSDDGDVDAASGTFGIVGAADTGWHLRPAVDGKSALGVWSRDAEGGEWPLIRVGPSWQVTDGPIPDASLGERSQEIVSLVAKRGDDGTRAADVADALMGLSEHQARTYLDRLAKGDRIGKRGRGLYVPAVSVASVASVASGEAEPPLVQRLATHTTHATQVEGDPWTS